MKKIYTKLLMGLFLSLSVLSLSAQVSVTATAGTLGPTAYATVLLAFDAINAGTHQGSIVVSINGNTTETGSCVLNSSGTGSSSYSSVIIKPTVLATIAGPTTAGRGLIEFFGSDNVTIDGSIAVGGTSRDLTITNTAVATQAYSSAVRIAVFTGTDISSADNNTIKNCNLNGNAVGQNIATATSTTGSANTTFGVYCGGTGGATQSATLSNISSVTTKTAILGTTINNLIINNNAINQCARAIVFNGAVATVAPGTTTISNNLIGDQVTSNTGATPYTSPTTTVYTKGIWVAGTSSVTINNNTLKNIISYVGTTMTAIELVSPNLVSTISNNAVTTISNNGTASIAKAILVTNSATSYTLDGNTVTNVQTLAGANGTAAIEAIAAGSTNSIIQNNKVTTVYSRNAGTFGAWGINITNGTGVQIRNNFISDLNMDMSGGVAFSISSGLHGIRIIGGTGHKVYHNSVNLFGSLLGTASSAILTSAFTVSVSTVTGLDVRNNIFSNNLTGGTTGIAHVSIYLPSGATSAMDLTINNNAYYSGAASGSQGIAHGGSTYTSPVVTAGIGLYEAANFDAASTNPVTNLRNYTATLSVAGTNDDASFAITTAPPFTTNTDLHINSLAAGSAVLDNSGAAVGVTTDIDAQSRSALTPDIGADEFTFGVVPIAIEFFRGSKLAGANYLDWKVNCVNEPSVILSLERSADGRNFKSIQVQTATDVRCQQGFSFTDNSPLAGVNYYRLKTTTADGKFRYSVIVALINREKGFELVSISPNPVKTNATLSLSSVKGGIMTISVSDVTGKVVMKQSLTVIAGNNPIDMNFSKLGAGTYNITVMNAENEIKTARFVKY